MKDTWKREVYCDFSKQGKHQESAVTEEDFHQFSLSDVRQISAS